MQEEDFEIVMNLSLGTTDTYMRDPGVVVNRSSTRVNLSGLSD